LIDILSTTPQEDCIVMPELAWPRGSGSHKLVVTLIRTRSYPNSSCALL